MPTPRQDETRQEFISRCIPIVLEDGTAESQDQAIAVCNSMWREREEQGKMDEHKMEHKTFSGFVTKAEEQGVIEAVFAVFGNVDSGNDVLHPGAFSKTFAEQGQKVKVLDNHQTDSLMRAIGKVLLLKEVRRDELPAELLEKQPDASGGAFARVQMLMDTPEGKGAFIRLRDGAIDQWSFGYDALDTDFGVAVRDGKEVNIRNLRTVKLYEISPVIFGMNEATQTVSAKSDDPIEQFGMAVARAMAEEEDREYTKGVLGATNPSDLDEAKVGRVISAATGKRIQGAIDGIQAALGSLEKMLADAGVTAALPAENESEEESEKSAPVEQAALKQNQGQAGPQDHAPTSEEMLEQIERHLLELGG